MSRSKIVCTIGPASRSAKTLRSMAEAGMDVVRLNASHGTHSEHKEVIDRVVELSEEISLPLPILLDLGGAKIRIGPIDDRDQALAVLAELGGNALALEAPTVEAA